jgi:hypothetical protein
MKEVMTGMSVSLRGIILAAPLLFHTVVRGGNTMDSLEALATADPKPFVVVEATTGETVSRGQGVVVSPQGHVLSAGHLCWNEPNLCFADRFRISFRGPREGLPPGAVHTHKAVFSDREDRAFFEHYFPAELVMQDGTRFVGQADLALFRIQAEGDFPRMAFFSEQKPSVKIGDVLHLCHYSFPNREADPAFLMNPVTVVGVAQTSSGLQYLGEGYYRVGSSGGALLKDGRLVGIQSAAYTVNAEGIGEMPMGLISFQLVWGELFDGMLEPPPAPAPGTATPRDARP